MDVLSTIIILFFVHVILYLYKLFHSKPYNFPPGPGRLPLWGSYWFLLKENYYFMHESLQALANRYKTKILGLHLGSAPTVVVFGKDLCKEVLTREEFSGRYGTVLTKDRSSGELLGIFFVEGSYWKEQRRFSLRQLRDFGHGRRFQSMEAIFERETRDLIELMTSEPKAIDSDVCRKNGQILFPDIMYAPVLNCICHMLIGRRVEDNFQLREMSRAISRFLRSTDGLGGAIIQTPWLKHVAPDFFGYTAVMKGNQVPREFFEKEMIEHKLNFSKDHLSDFTDVYLNKIQEVAGEETSSFSEKQLLWTLVDYMFPAPVLVGETLNYLFSMLLINPEILSKIQEEIDRVVGNSRLPNLDDRKNMPYTEATIREVLRWSSLNPLGVGRKSIQDTMLGGYFIPKNTFVVPHLWSVNRDPDIWTDPDCFLPERFLDEDGILIKNDPTIVFGAGKRLCAGETFARQCIFLFTSGLCQNFDFSSINELPNVNKRKWGLMVTVPSLWLDAVIRQC